jgi:hypothetical protein
MRSGIRSAHTEEATNGDAVEKSSQLGHFVLFYFGAERKSTTSTYNRLAATSSLGRLWKG